MKMKKGKKTRVVNIRKETFDVYIGRAGHGVDGPFGNPIRIKKMCPVCLGSHTSGGGTLGCFEEWARARMVVDPDYREAVRNLWGKRLGCFCKNPNKCHGSILLKLTEELHVKVEKK